MNIANIIINKFEKTNIISYRFLFCFFFPLWIALCKSTMKGESKALRSGVAARSKALGPNDAARTT